MNDRNSGRGAMVVPLVVAVVLSSGFSMKLIANVAFEVVHFFGCM